MQQNEQTDDQADSPQRTFEKPIHKMSCLIIPSHKNKLLQPAKLFLYQHSIVIVSKSHKECWEIDFSLNFEIKSSSNQMTICQMSRQEAQTLQFSTSDQLQKTYNHLKKRIFQTNFEDKYTIKQKIASGMTSKVFKIERLSDGQTFAAKIYRKIPSSIQRELQILGCLEHPNIIFLEEVFLHESCVFIVMSYEKGHNLLKQIEEQQFLSISGRVKFLTDMLNALEFLRVKNIVHRDIKPENIIFSQTDGNYKLVDFELGSYCGQLTTKKAGTPGYLAPELFKRHIEFNHKADIYSLGLVYFELATKKMYYHGIDQSSIYEKNKKTKSLTKKGFSKDQISPREYEVLRMMIRTNPENRKVSLEILKSQEFQKMRKQFSMGLNKTSSSVNSSPKKALEQEMQIGLDEQSFAKGFLKLLKIKSSA